MEFKFWKPKAVEFVPEVIEETINCPTCGEEILKKQVAQHFNSCPNCQHYFRISAPDRIKMIADRGTFGAWFEELTVSNPLGFSGYEEKLAEARKKTGLTEAVTVGTCKIGGEAAVLGVCDARFMMSSMGQVVGERITSAVEKATKLRLPFVLFCCSGGARMQEGIISLMQMAKTSAALKKHSDAGLLYIPVLTDPTTGGVSASFAMLGDIILAEPGALIGFAGPRVIEQTIGQKLPDGFQRAQFQLEHGFVDKIIKREDMKGFLGKLIKLHRVEGVARFDFSEGEILGPTEIAKELAATDHGKTPWEKVKASRQTDRPGALNYIKEIFTDFVELHGDRYYADDKAIVGGIAYLDGQPVTVIGIEKGKDSIDCMNRNFGMPSPEGYRKALRLMKQAEKFGRPIITFVNTSGAYPGLEAEQRGQGEAIARNLYEMATLKVPVLNLMIGEGGSGGALALAVGNEVWMLEHAIYCILSPEGFSSILWKDKSRAEEASSVMKITAQDLKELGVIEKIIPEYGGANAKTFISISRYLKKNIRGFLTKYETMSDVEIMEERIARYRAF
ncbi:MAG: acetyl-CoA carboxylase carboxyltransferase subunit alpha [Lachnospiraceae bacterium]